MQRSIADEESSVVPSTESQRFRGKRKWAPKSRDGCAICRSRRVKCDETRPSCFRCRRLGVECRYTTVAANDVGPQGYSRGFKQSAIQMINWSRTPSYGTPEESRYLGTFQYLATPWLGQYVCKPLFSELIPQASWSHPGVRHALVAASMASEEYLCRPAQVRPHRREWHYARALQHLYRDSELNGDIAIMAAVLLWTHDMTMKNAVAAMVHMIGFLGLTIAKKYRKLALNRTADLEIEVLRGMIGWGHVQAPDTREHPDQAVVAAIRARIKSSSYAEVAGEYSSPFDEYKLFMFSTGWTRERDDAVNEPSDALYFDEMYDFIDRWYLEFSSRPDMSAFDQQLLFHYHKTSYYVIDGLKPGCHYVKDDDFETLQWIEDVLVWLESIDSETIAQRPGKKDIILPLNSIPTQLEFRRSNPEILLRIVALLGRWDRLEGMWNDTVLAKLVYASKFGLPQEEEATVVSKRSLEKKVGITAAKENRSGEKDK